MTVRCFVDANVLVYARDPREPLKQKRATQWIDRLWERHTGRTSCQVLSEFYSVATRKLAVPADQAWDEASRYFAWAPHEINQPLLRRAHEIERRYRLSWWDSMIVAAAQLQDCVILLTEDLQEGMVFGTLAVRSPFSSVLEEPPAEYSVARAHPLHRPRGRPRRSSIAA
jgi:predicted nucleic acid-binding protein